MRYHGSPDADAPHLRPVRPGRAERVPEDNMRMDIDDLRSWPFRG